MKLPDHLRHEIQRWLAEYIAATDPRLADHRALAVRLHALPLYADMGGCIAIRPDGDVIFVDIDQDWTDPERSDLDPDWRTVALAVGSWTYPALATLLPPRGPADIDCPECEGTGGERVASVLVCGACLGLGWRPA